ncbi:hypothetical protein M409DRAFT_20226 [Zasmidium cellare ATCC 36951]|uniref:GAR domain-containing protein n=1 Tax=Zasmidium cellare ATCC 36951 TaxID=1080233 RepID=A0A6A6CVG9_ZASCE|nr:uncharacterized protein M409DRAFT_20226 [Zasmidium cellare ATCC 36951]KAF2169812.1 hypothetical protein M409DRAFT_20226 [Zasmidium cellare ATCC 36951]
MHPGNPFTNAPALPRPKGHLHSRSISRSPARQHARDFDPLLRDLSPTTTLRAFVSDPEDMGGQEPDVLMRTVQTTSISERALGAKAAQACLDLRAWTRELEDWQWSGTFEVPEPARKKMRMSNFEHNNTSSANGVDADEEYWGSLPATTVQEYERRADEIGHSLDQINVEELKDYVLSSHYRVESRPQSRDSNFGANSTTTDMKKLDDYTAVVTATILHALPFLSKLNRLLDTWTIRLIILRSAPNYLRDLKQARTDLDDGWAALAAPSSAISDVSQEKFDRQTMEEMKDTLEAQVSSLGGKLDRFLDNLEGRDDSLPDTWIDDFELLESSYGAWVVQAERKVLEHEWRGSIHRTELEARPLRSDAEDQRPATRNQISELEDAALDHDAVRRLSMRSTDAAGFLARSQELPAATTGALKPGNHAVESSADSGPAELDTRPVPVLISSDVEPTSAVEGQGIARVPSSGSVSKEDGMGQVAKRRAQFLNDIERNQSLMKTSKSPVRPFEHASNAFTRLFKKDRSPEQVKPKRTTSNKWSSGTNADDRSVSAERNPLSPVSVASSKFNATSMASSVPSATSSSKTSQVGSPETDQLPAKHDGSVFDQYDTGESHEEPPYYTQDHYREINEIMRDEPQPSNLSSPFHSPAKESVPNNWPLASPADTPQEDNMFEKQDVLPSNSSRHRADSGPEVNSPDLALLSDEFDRIFIESLPAAPEERPGSARAPTRTTPWTNTYRRPASLPRNVRKHMPEMSKYSGSYLDMVSVNNQRTGSSSGLPNGASRSDVPAMSRPSSKDQANGSTLDHGGVGSDGSAMDTSRSLKLTIPENESNVDRPSEKRPQAAKRASIASIEAFPRSQLKTIDVPRLSRRSSASPGITPPQTPPRSREPSTAGGADADEAGPMSYKGMVAFPTPPPRRVSASSRATPPPALVGKESPTVLRSLPRSSPAKSDVNGSPLGDENTSPSAPLNVAMAKRRGKSTLRVENSPSSPISSPQKTSHSRVVEEDTFDRHVSEVLETLPGQIRFASRAGAETPSLRPAYNGPRPKIQSGRSSRAAGMTIAPAESSPKKTSSASEPEVKLYHLTTSGRDEPIKLFVRLVGEGERVMVRVGGGWADLADYLRQYAEHHGSRTVSEGNLEVQTVTSAPGSRKASGAAEMNRAKSPVPGPLGTPRPSSKDSDNEWSFPVLSNGRSTPSTTGRQTPTMGSTPKSSSGSSRPSTANVSRPPSRQNTGEVGLAGPSSGKKSALPEQKAKWVEGMIERAKQASAEKSKDEKQKYFGELGKAGGTRRVIFRSSSGTGEKPSK